MTMIGEQALRARGAAQVTDWPTTLRFSRRLGESVRDADYAAAIEGPQGRAVPHLEADLGLCGRLLAHLRGLRRGVKAA